MCLLPKNAELQSDKDIPDMLEAPVSKNDVLGSITYSLDGEQIAKVELVSSADIPRAAQRTMQGGYFVNGCMPEGSAVAYF